MPLANLSYSIVNAVGEAYFDLIKVPKVMEEQKETLICKITGTKVKNAILDLKQ